MIGRVITLFLIPNTIVAILSCFDKSCGTSNSRIASPSGVVSEPHSRPFQVALYSRVGTTGQLGFCGASLIHPQWVLTAAHCCFHDSVMVDNVKAILGANSLYDRHENGRRVVNVDIIEVHPDYDPGTFNHDLALMRLVNVMQITDTIDVVQLPYLSQVNNNFAGQGAIVSGWGIASEGVPFVSPTLREFFMTTITDSQCQTSYQSQAPINSICGFNLTSSTCKGDNGGPMTITVIRDEIDETYLIGVTSFIDESGCNGDLPSVFTRVQRYLNWISETTGLALN